MHNFRRIGMLVGVTAVLIVGIFSLAQAKSAALETAGGSTIYLPALFTPGCEIFSDDFSNSNSGWPQGLSPGIAQVDYDDDEYAILSLGAGLKRVVAPAPAVENYLVEADMRLNGPPTNALIGLVFGLQFDGSANVSDYYVFAVIPESQEYALFRLERLGPDDYDVITIEGLTMTAAINTGTNMNHLTAVRNGIEIELNVNGTDLGVWENDYISGPSYTGLALNPNPNNIDADGRYDNFSVQGCLENGAARTAVNDTMQRPDTFSISDPVDLINK